MVQGRGISTRQALIDATAKRLSETDETELRIADICEDTGFSSSVIYSNFRSRQGLVDAALLWMYDDQSRRYIDILRQNTAGADSTASLVSFYRLGEGEGPIPGALKEFRRIRLRVSTAALARPELRREFLPVQEGHLQRLAALIEEAQDQGLFGRRLNGRQLAVLLEGMGFGRALDEISLHPESGDSWMEMLLLILGSL